MTKQEVSTSKKATKKKSTTAASPAKRPSKLSQLEAMLRRPEGANGLALRTWNTYMPS